MDMGIKRRPILCYKCGGIMRKIGDEPESYECECGYAIRRANKEESELSLLAFREIETR